MKTIIQLVYHSQSFASSLSPRQFSGGPTARWRLSWRQHGRRAKCSFESYQRRVLIPQLVGFRSATHMAVLTRLPARGTPFQHSDKNTAFGAAALLFNTVGETRKRAVSRSLATPPAATATGFLQHRRRLQHGQRFCNTAAPNTAVGFGTLISTPPATTTRLWV